MDATPDIIEIENETVALALSTQGIIPPPEWRHDPEIQNSNANTVAMNLALNGIIPPPEWRHDPRMQNDYNGNTVAMYLAENRI